MSSLVQIRQWSELDSWYPQSTEEDTDGPWPWVELSTLLVPVTDSPQPPDLQEEVGLAGVRWYGAGVFERERRAPNQLSSKYSRLVEGALVYNRLFAWKQSFAVVGENEAQLYVSNEFPQFLAATGEISVEFAALVLASPYYADRIFSRSTGSTAVSRNRLKEKDFLLLKIPLPDRDVQDALVEAAQIANIEAMTSAEQLDKRRAQAWSTFEKALGFDGESQEAVEESVAFTVRFADCDRWDTDAARRVARPGVSGMDWANLAELATVSGGIQKSPSNRPGLEARPYLRVANVQRGKLVLTEVKNIEVSDSRLAKLRLEPGDILFVEGNGSPDEIGRSALWGGEIENCVHQNHLIKARIFSPRLVPRFALAWFNSSAGRRHFNENARTTSGLLTLNLEDIRSAPVPLPDVPDQELIAQQLWDELDEVDRLAALSVKAESDTLKRFNQEVFGSAE